MTNTATLNTSNKNTVNYAGGGGGGDDLKTRRKLISVWNVRTYEQSNNKVK